MNASRNKSITVTFFDGRPDGIRKCEDKGDTVVLVYIVPRCCLSRAWNDQALNKELDSKNGIYYLVGKSPDSEKTMVYVGQTTRGFQRLADHNYEKEFWRVAIFFMADRKKFTREILDGLEQYAIKQVKALKRYSCDNSNDPRCTSTDEEQGYVENYYDEIRFYMAAFGYPLTDEGFEISSSTAEVDRDTAEVLEVMGASSPQGQSKNEIEHVEQNSHTAQCWIGNSKDGPYAEVEFHYPDKTTVILAGASVDLSKEPHSGPAKDKRQESLNDGRLVKNKNGFYKLMAPVTFKKPTPAVEFVLGGSLSGPRYLKTKGAGGKIIAIKDQYPDLFPNRKS